MFPPPKRQYGTANTKRMTQGFMRELGFSSNFSACGHTELRQRVSRLALRGARHRAACPRLSPLRLRPLGASSLASLEALDPMVVRVRDLGACHGHAGHAVAPAGRAPGRPRCWGSSAAAPRSRLGAHRDGTETLGRRSWACPRGAPGPWPPARTSGLDGSRCHTPPGRPLAGGAHVDASRHS